VPPPILSAASIASLIQTAINGAYNAANFPVTAFVNGASSRISFFPDNPIHNVTVGGFSDALRYLDPVSGGGSNSMPFLYLYAEGGNGAAPVLQAYPQPAAPGAPGDLDGLTFTIGHSFTFPTTVHTFEFQLPGTPAPAAGRIPVPIDYGWTGSQVATAMANAIQSLQVEYGVTGTQYNNDDRVVVNGMDVTFNMGTSPINNLMAPLGNGGLVPGGGILIAAKEAYPIDPDVDLRTTNQRIADAIMDVVNTHANSPFIMGAEAASQTGRINFPPITNRPGRVPVMGIDADGMPTWAPALDDTGAPNSFARPGVSTGAIAIPFLAFEHGHLPSTGAREAIDPISGAPIIVQGGISNMSIASRVEAAIDTYITPSTGISASSQGRFVTLSRGRIELPAAPNSPFASRGPIIQPGSDANPPGGIITGIVHLPELTEPGIDYFLAVSDKGGLYQVRVDWLDNQNLPVFDPGGNWNTAKRRQVTTFYIGESEQDLSGISFQGLTRGPAGVEGGRYANTWFAVADDALIPPPGAIVAPNGFTESEGNNSMPRFGGVGNTDETFVTHIAPNLIGNQPVYQSVMTNGFLGDGAFAFTTGDYDFYHFQANVGDTVIVEVQGAGSSANYTLVDSAITIYNSAGVPIASDDNSGNGFDARVVFKVGVNGAGDYYIAVRSGGTAQDLLDPFDPTTGSGANNPGNPNGYSWGTYGLTVTRLVDSGSVLHAFAYDPVTGFYGGMQPIFADGNTSLPLVDRQGNRIQDAVGIRFGELQRNLWTMTPYVGGQHRQLDPGHGMNLAEHESEGPNADSNGHSSFYFGRGGVGTFYDFNNGAYGSIVSNEFSLEGYSAIDQPVLYFTYYSDHEISPLYDSLRVFISGIADNNADRDNDGIADFNSGNWYPLSADDTTLLDNIPVQPTFTGTGSWRQVRVPLDAFAGMQGLRLRIDFSTAGDMDVGVPFSTGEEIRTVAGQFITDGQYIQIDDQIFELNSGVTATFASGRATPDGELITLVDAFGVTSTFEFDKDGVTSGGTTPVRITDEMSPQQVAQALLDSLIVPGGSVVGNGFFDFENNGSIGSASETFITYQGPNPIYQNFLLGGFLGDGPFAFTSGDYDFYHVQANEGEGLVVEVLGAGYGGGYTLGNSFVTIYDSTGVIVAQDDNSGPGNDALVRYTVPAGGTGDYYIVVRSGGQMDLTDPFDPTTGSGPGSIGSYGLLITRTSPLFAETSFLGTGGMVSDPRSQRRYRRSSGWQPAGD
jgi:hypothetical protein